MAFWVVDGGRSLGATGRGPYYVGGKRRVSHSDGGDGFTFDPKRTRFADAVHNTVDALPYDAYDNAPVAGPSGHFFSANGSHYEHRQPMPHHGIHHGNTVYPHSHSYSPSMDDEFPHHDDIESTPPPYLTPPDSIPIKSLAFLVIRERSPTPEGPDFPSIDAGLGFGSTPEPRPAPAFSPPGPAHVPDACAMERTASGLSISSDTTQHSLASLDLDTDDHHDPGLLSDHAAARLVRDHVAGLGSHRRRHRRSDSRHGRILRTLINPNPRAADVLPIDNDALRSIFSAANELFFDNRLAGRVAWDWSHPASAQYQAHIVGTTAVRRSRDGGYETLIVLSSPILKDTKYNRRLLISTFLHEMIHSYLFVTCGMKARHNGGHTEGFRQVADTIDSWVGRGDLRLSEMDADLSHYREHPASCAHEQHQVRSRSADDDRRMPWRSERWESRPRDDSRLRDEYYPNVVAEPRPRPHPDHDEWEWYDREGHRARDGRRGVSPYVY
ncbi:hypothetical protein FZEAL_6730 [Fusarium zealandicum]|uniref:SprT-like domain-containing protein n=1 Tax=Fusarium zealandicum TaxID=1053134 RepID=A0A8H4UHS6_9HYPO|nr:hypothetical protein FZEAL_6730 [Fusarium zealandicum]